MTKTRILCSVGTRPEAVKMAPVIHALLAEDWAEVRVVATAQHRELLDEVLQVFDIVPDIDLDIMKPDQTLADLTARLIESLDRVMADESPHLVLAQGDTTNVFVTALASHYNRIPFGHVEAGLRTGRRYYPFPEEGNRVLVSRLASYHFAPTDRARANLLAEGIDENTVFVTGNTVIDALHHVLERSDAAKIDLPENRRIVLMTAHRRENFGPGFREICAGVRTLADEVGDVEVVYPVHPNPNVAAVAKELLGGHRRIRLLPPLDYVTFVGLMNRATLVLTDSGGIQEEAPALGKPVLVFRNETERVEAVEAGVAKLVGLDRRRIVAEGVHLLTDPDYYATMVRRESPFGDGHAARRIVDVIREFKHTRSFTTDATGDDLAGLWTQGPRNPFETQDG